MKMKNIVGVFLLVMVSRSVMATDFIIVNNSADDIKYSLFYDNQSHNWRSVGVGDRAGDTSRIFQLNVIEVEYNLSDRRVVCFFKVRDLNIPIAKVGFKIVILDGCKIHINGKTIKGEPYVVRLKELE